MSVAENVAAEVRAELARQRRTRKALAEHLGWSQQNLNYYINGDRPWRIDELAEVALWLGVPLEQFTAAAS